MKRLFLILCLFGIAAMSNNAIAFYNCTDRQGNSIITDNPPADAICEEPGDENGSGTGENLAERQKIINTLNSLERKSLQEGLTGNEREWQTQLLEKLSYYDTDNANRRIIKILETLESKSIAGGLTKVERTQQTKLIKLQRNLSKQSTADDSESNTDQQEADIGVQNDEQKEKQAAQKAEMRRLLKIPRLGY